MMIKISNGDLADKVSILQWKVRDLTGEQQKQAGRELVALDAAFKMADIPQALYDALRRINEMLRKIEDERRACYKSHNYGAAWHSLNSETVRLNDERARIKRAINDETGSEIVEVKSYGG